MNYALQVLLDAVSLGSLYALSALGVGLLFGVMRLINFAHGDFITVGAYALIVPSLDITARLFIGSWAWPWMVLAIVAVVVCLALLSERIVFRPLRRADPATLLIASFALSFLLEYTLLLVYGGRPKAVNVGAGLNEQILIGDLRVPKLDLLTIVVTAVLLVALAAFMKRTSFGIQIRAASQDFRMARMLGVRADTVIATAFAVSGILAAAVSLLFIARTGILFPRMGVPLVMIAFVATVIGGMGSLVGACLGGFIVGAASALMQAVLPEDLRPNRDAFVFAIVILILLIRPEGLIRLRSSRERV
jgi:branched-chain amino acid transport system permease protein